MERVHRADLTLHHTLPLHPDPGPGHAAGPGEDQARGGGGHQGDR